MLDVENIIRIIEEKGYKCNSVEKALGFGNGSIRRWNKNSPSIKKLYQLSNFLNVDLNFLLTGQEVPKEKASNTENTNKHLDLDIEDLSEESKEELGKFVRLLKIKDSVDKTKD